MKVTILILFLISIITFVLCKSRSKTSQTSATTKKCHLRKDYWNDQIEPNLVAVALLRGQGNSRKHQKAMIKFEQQYYGGPVRISGMVENIKRAMKRGFFILEYGRHRCNKEGIGHFNPTNSPHGTSASCHRHHGDLEPITLGGQLKTFIQWDPRVKLQGPYSIIGRTVAIVRREDDEDEDSLRIACGIIGYANNTNFTSNTFHIPSVEDHEIPAHLLAFVIVLLSVGFAKVVYDHYWIKSREGFHFNDPNIENVHKRRIEKLRKLQNNFLWNDKNENRYYKSKLREQEERLQELAHIPSFSKCLNRNKQL